MTNFYKIAAAAPEPSWWDKGVNTVKGWFEGGTPTSTTPAAVTPTAPTPYVPTPEQTQAYQQSQQQQEALGQQLQARRAAGQPVDDLLQQMGQLSKAYSTAAAAVRGRPTQRQRTPAQIANMAQNYRMNNLPVPPEFQAPPIPMPNNDQNQLTAGVPMRAPVSVPGVSGVTATPPVAAKPTSFKAPKVATWFGVVKQSAAPIKPPERALDPKIPNPIVAKSAPAKVADAGQPIVSNPKFVTYDQLKAMSQSLKNRLEGITNDRVQGNAEMNARLDQASNALDSTSKLPVIGPDTPYVRNAGHAAVYEHQHNVPPPPLTYGQLERNADVAGAGSGMLSDAGKSGLTMPGRGEQLNPVEQPSYDPRMQGARLIEAIHAAKRMNLPFTVEHFLAGYVNPETVLHEDNKRSMPTRRPPSTALPYAIPFAGR